MDQNENIDCEGALIIVQNLSVLYNTKYMNVKAINNLSAVFPRGKLIGIMGPSGSGKSTLIKSLTGLIKPTTGSIYYKINDELVNFSELGYEELLKFRRNYFGIISQHDNAFEYLTVEENLLLAQKLNLESSCSEEQTRTIILETLGMVENRNKLAEQLSGGELQRLAIGIALIKQSDIIFADEPTGELDYENTFKIFELFRKLVDDFDKTVIVVSHNQILESYSDLLFIIQSGEIISMKNKTNQP